MKRTNISEMTAAECDVELTLHAIKELIQKARKEHQKAADANKAVFQALDDMCIDATTIAYHCQRGTLAEAIAEYIVHGTMNLKKIMNDIREGYTEGE